MTSLSKAAGDALEKARYSIINHRKAYTFSEFCE